MAPATTLVTFLFDCPAASRSVELLGSWDNFSKPYHLKPDLRRGRATWTGCFSFTEIICDGDPSNLSERRSGPLLMGGTYWYYYKIDDDEEYHNPSEPSTTFCPLLPGQRLNIMEVPIDTRTKSNSQSSDGFTRNPQDKYLNPIPPKTMPSPRLGDYCQEPYSGPIYRHDPPKSATYPAQTWSRPSGFERNARSANTSPRFAPSAIIPELKSLKDKFARGNSPQRQQRELEIGAPTLISTTAEDVNLIPLTHLQPPSTSSAALPSPVELKRREFAPLRSNPVDVRRDLSLDIPRSAPVSNPSPRRPQSESSPTTPSGLGILPGRTRANSTDTRRTRVYVYSNEPWLSSPLLPQGPVFQDEPMPILQKPSLLELPGSSAPERPTSSHGGDRNTMLRKTPLDKELPALPRYLVPAPLFACQSPSASPLLPDIADEEEVEEAKSEESQSEKTHIDSTSSKHSRFSTWSSDSSFSASQSDDEPAHSPTFSSLTSESSDDETDMSAHESNTGADNNKPLPTLRLPSFSPDLFTFDLQDGANTTHRSTLNRKTACFGFSGFQGYSLPSDETESQTTITKASLVTEPTIAPDRSSSVSQLEKLMSDFGYLGESVL